MINLLPLEEKKKVRGEYFARLTITGLFFLLATLAIAMVFLISSYVSLNTEESTARERLEAYASEEAQDAKEFDQVIKDTNKKLEILQGDDRSKRIYDEVFGVIIGSKGAVRITGLTYEKDKTDIKRVRLAGISPDRESLLAFTNILEQENLFTNVEVPVSNFVKEHDIEFSMEITLGI